MVRETINMSEVNVPDEGQGVGPMRSVAGGYGDTPPRYPNVYNSTRIIQNWEMARIAHLVMTKDKNLGRRLARVLVTDDRADNLIDEHKNSCKGVTEALYQALLGWQAGEGGCGTMGIIARRLRDQHLDEIAEFFPP